MALLDCIKQSTSPAPFSSHSHTISPLYFYLFSLPAAYLKWKDRSKYSSAIGNFSQRTYSVKSISITVIPSFSHKTKTVIWSAPILLCCQLCCLKYSNRGRWDPSIYLTAIISCLSIHTQLTCVRNRTMTSQSVCRKAKNLFHDLEIHLCNQHNVLKEEKSSYQYAFLKGTEIGFKYYISGSNICP